jgi:hypothetical protein
VRSLVRGWLVILAILAPLPVAYLLVGDDGPYWVMLGYLVLMLLWLGSMMAVSIGDGWEHRK